MDLALGKAHRHTAILVACIVGLASIFNIFTQSGSGRIIARALVDPMGIGEPAVPLINPGAFNATWIDTAEPVIEVAEVSGNVRAVNEKTGRNELLTLGSTLAQGDTVITGDASYAQVVINRNQRQTIDQNTALDYTRVGINGTSNSFETVLFLQRGNVLSQVEKALTGAERYEVHTETSFMAVRGTTVNMGYDPGTHTSVIGFLEGHGVAGSQDTGEQLALTAGQQVRDSGSGESFVPEYLDLTQIPVLLMAAVPNTAELEAVIGSNGGRPIEAFEPAENDPLNPDTYEPAEEVFSQNTEIVADITEQAPTPVSVTGNEITQPSAQSNPNAAVAQPNINVTAANTTGLETADVSATEELPPEGELTPASVPVESAELDVPLPSAGPVSEPENEASPEPSVQPSGEPSSEPEEETSSPSESEEENESEESNESSRSTESPASTAEPTLEPTPTAEPTSEPTPTAEPTLEPTPTAEPTSEPTPTAEPTPEPTPTAEPTPEPTPTTEPTPEPTPTAEPTSEPTPTAEPTPDPKIALMDTAKNRANELKSQLEKTESAVQIHTQYLAVKGGYDAYTSKMGNYEDYLSWYHDLKLNSNSRANREHNSHVIAEMPDEVLTVVVDLLPRSSVRSALEWYAKDRSKNNAINQVTDMVFREKNTLIGVNIERILYERENTQLKTDYETAFSALESLDEDYKDYENTKSKAAEIAADTAEVDSLLNDLENAPDLDAAQSIAGQISEITDKHMPKTTQLTDLESEETNLEEPLEKTGLTVKEEPIPETAAITTNTSLVPEFAAALIDATVESIAVEEITAADMPEADIIDTDLADEKLEEGDTETDLTAEGDSSATEVISAGTDEPSELEDEEALDSAVDEFKDGGSLSEDKSSDENTVVSDDSTVIDENAGTSDKDIDLDSEDANTFEDNAPAGENSGISKDDAPAGENSGISKDDASAGEGSGISEDNAPAGEGSGISEDNASAGEGSGISEDNAPAGEGSEASEDDASEKDESANEDSNTSHDEESDDEPNNTNNNDADGSEGSKNPDNEKTDNEEAGNSEDAISDDSDSSLDSPAENDSDDGSGELLDAIITKEEMEVVDDFIEVKPVDDGED